MKTNLVTTNIKETFDDKSQNILLGEWCKSNLDNNIFLKNSKTIKFHLNDNDKLINGHKYLNGLFYKILENLTIHMNNIHQVKKSQRYWHIILGSWLIHQISILWDRWECIDKAFQDVSLNETKCLKYNLSEVIASDIVDLQFNYGFGHRWNHILCSEIIKFKYSSKIKINFIEDKSKNFSEKKYIINLYKGQLNSGKKINKFSIFDYLLKKIFKNPKIILFNTYFDRKNKILIPLALRTLPRIYSEFEQNIEMPSPEKREKIKLTFKDTNKFEEFVKETLFKLMPVSYLEGYKTILTEVEKINYSPKVILTSTGIFSNDLFQIWTANQVSEGAKLLICEHGGCWEKDEYFKSLTEMSDFHLSWTKNDNKKTIQVPMQLNLKKKKILKSISAKNILMLLNSELLYNLRLRHQPMCGQILEDYNLWKSFINNLDNKIRNNLIIRPHPSHDSWNLIKKCNEDFGENYISKKSFLKDDTNRAKIIVDTHIQSPFFENMKTGIPMITLFNRSILNMDNKISNIFDIFLDNKIIVQNPIEASKHIKNIWENPLEWWNNKKTVYARDLFTEFCSMETKNNLIYWKNILQNQINNNFLHNQNRNI